MKKYEFAGKYNIIVVAENKEEAIRIFKETADSITLQNIRDKFISNPNITIKNSDIKLIEDKEVER